MHCCLRVYFTPVLVSSSTSWMVELRVCYMKIISEHTPTAVHQPTHTCTCIHLHVSTRRYAVLFASVLRLTSQTLAPAPPFPFCSKIYTVTDLTDSMTGTSAQNWCRRLAASFLCSTFHMRITGCSGRLQDNVLNFSTKCLCFSPT